MFNVNNAINKIRSEQQNHHQSIEQISQNLINTQAFPSNIIKQALEYRHSSEHALIAMQEKLSQNTKNLTTIQQELEKEGFFTKEAIERALEKRNDAGSALK